MRENSPWAGIKNIQNGSPSTNRLDTTSKPEEEPSYWENQTGLRRGTMMKTKIPWEDGSLGPRGMFAPPKHKHQMFTLWYNCLRPPRSRHCGCLSSLCYNSLCCQFADIFLSLIYLHVDDLVRNLTFENKRVRWTEKWEFQRNSFNTIVLLCNNSLRAPLATTKPHKENTKVPPWHPFHVFANPKRCFPEFVFR